MLFPWTSLLLIRRVELEVNLTTGPTLTNLFVTYLSEVDQQTVSIIFCAQVSYRFVHLHVGLWRETFYLSSPSSITGLAKPKPHCCISNSLTIEFCLPPKTELITMKTLRHQIVTLISVISRSTNLLSTRKQIMFHLSLIKKFFLYLASINLSSQDRKTKKLIQTKFWTENTSFGCEK